jgi:hypothetical protein
MKRLLCIAIAIINFCLPGKIYPKNTPKIAEDKKLVLDFNDDISENAQIKNFGALWSKNGISQGCYEFDGASSCMAIPSSNLKIGDEFTISMWTYRKSEKKGGLLYKEGLFNLNTSYWGIFKNDKWHIIEYDLPVNKWSNIMPLKRRMKSNYI